MRFQVLISCMNNNSHDLIQNSNLKEHSALVVNQCKTADDQLRKIDDLHYEYRSSEKGLSVSRNTAVKLSSAEICLISDDDEVFVDDLEKKVISAYNKIPEADVIIFAMSNRPLSLGKKVKRLRWFDTLKVSSWQISFKRSSITNNRISFDIKLGAGTGNGAGEENKFLLDCLKNKLKIYYVPCKIASVAQEESTWFHGYTPQFFYDRGKTTRYILGFPISFVYALYYIATKRKMYIQDISSFRALKSIIKGIVGNEISKQK